MTSAAWDGSVHALILRGPGGSAGRSGAGAGRGSARPPGCRAARSGAAGRSPGPPLPSAHLRAGRQHGGSAPARRPPPPPLLARRGGAARAGCRRSSGFARGSACAEAGAAPEVGVGGAPGLSLSPAGAGSAGQQPLPSHHPREGGNLACARRRLLRGVPRERPCGRCADAPPLLLGAGTYGVTVLCSPAHGGGERMALAARSEKP